MGVADLVHVGIAQRAFLRQGIVDRLVEVRVVAGRVLVPDFEISRQSGLVEGTNLLEADPGEGKCSFVLVTGHGHE
jgi:hypothetical protein